MPDKSAPVRGGDGYYVLNDGTRLLSVTNIKKGGIPLDLSGWAGYQTGLLAMDMVPKLTRVRGAQNRRDMAIWLGQVNERIMSEAGTLGGHVHDAIEAHILGLTIPVMTEREQLFFDAYQNFFEIECPIYEATELKVANLDDEWMGTADCYAHLPRRKKGLYLLDWKTSSKAHAEFALQLAAYIRATLAWLRDGTEVEPPKAEHAAVVHIRPDKYPDCGYRIVPMDTSDDVYQCFLYARRIAIEWDRGLSKSARKRALKVLEREVVGGVVVDADPDIAETGQGTGPDTHGPGSDNSEWEGATGEA